MFAICLTNYKNKPQNMSFNLVYNIVLFTMEPNQSQSLKIPAQVSKKYSLSQLESKMGGYSKVIYGTRISDGQKIVAKIYNFDRCHEDFTREIEALSRCKHPNIVKMLDYFSSDGNQIIILQAGAQHLRDYCDKQVRTIREKQNIMRQIIRANYYLWKEMKIMHRDIKLENVVKFGDVWKLIDFGFSTQKDIDQQTQKTMLGNLMGMAPEIINHYQYCFKSDIWSLGVLYYRVVFGVYPFNKEDTKKMEEQPYLNLKVSSQCNKDSADFISGCLRYRPQDRLNWDAIMRHPIMWDNTLDDILFKEYPITRSGKFFDHDHKVLYDVFEQPNDDIVRTSPVILKIMFLRKKVVVYFALFLEFSEAIIGNIFKDSSNGYARRKCLVPLFNHALYHIVQLVNLLKNKNFSVKTPMQINGTVELVDIRFPNTLFTNAEIDMFRSYDLRPRSLQYFQDVQNNIMKRIQKYSQQNTLEIVQLKQEEYKKAVGSLKETLEQAITIASNPILVADIEKLLKLMDKLLEPVNKCFLDSIKTHQDLEAFVKKFIFSTIIQNPEPAPPT